MLSLARMNASKSASVVQSGPGLSSPLLWGATAGWETMSRMSRMAATRSSRSCRWLRWSNTIDGDCPGSAHRRVTEPRLTGRDKSIQNWKPGTGTSFAADQLPAQCQELVLHIRVRLGLIGPQERAGLEEVARPQPSTEQPSLAASLTCPTARPERSASRRRRPSTARRRRMVLQAAANDRQVVQHLETVP